MFLRLPCAMGEGAAAAPRRSGGIVQNAGA